MVSFSHPTRETGFDRGLLRHKYTIMEMEILLGIHGLSLCFSIRCVNWADLSFDSIRDPVTKSRKIGDPG